MTTPRPGATAGRIGELLDHAILAVNAGDLAGAHELASRVLADDASNSDAEDLLATDELPAGEVRRLTMLGCDLVGSTELAQRLDPERYRSVVGRYRRRAVEVIEGRYGGHTVSTQGDGFLALFGYPRAHEDSALRAVRAALELSAAVSELSHQVATSAGGSIAVRAAVHRGVVYIDPDEEDVYGLAANVTARLESLAEPGTVVISEELRQLVGDRFDLQPGPPASVKGVSRPLKPYRVLREREGAERPGPGAPLIGRQRHLAHLRVAWHEVVSGTTSRPVSVLLRGDPGIGKSRLVHELAEEVRADGAAVIELAGSAPRGAVAFHPLHDLLAARCGIGRTATSTEQLTRLRQELGAHGSIDDLPVLAPVLGIPPRAGYEPVPVEGRKLHEMVQGAATRYIQRCFGGGPGLLVVEDVQWFDPSTAELVAGLLRSGPGHLLVVLTARATGTELPVAASATLDLEPLTVAESTELVAALDTEGLGTSATRALVDRADGVPLFLEVLVRAPGDATAAAPMHQPVPDVLYEPLVAQLSGATQGLVSAMAIAGREADRELIAAATDLSATDLDAGLAALVEANVLTAVGPPDERRLYRFRHELLREVAIELLPPSRRQLVHARVADLHVQRMTDGSPGDWLTVASHLEQAGRAGDAMAAYVRAADRARVQGALAQALQDLGRAIELVDQLPAGRTRLEQEVDLRLRRGFIAMSTEGAGSDGAAADYARCLELAMVDTRGHEMVSTLISLWAYHLARAELVRCRQVLDTLRASLTEDRERLLTINDAGRGMLSWFEGDTAGARALLEQAISELPDSDDDIGQVWFVPNDPVSAMHTHLALALGLAGDTVAADAALRQSDELTASLPFPQGPWSRAYRMWLGSWLLAERGRHDEALSLTRDLVALAEQGGFDTWTMIAMTQQAAVTALSQPDRAEVHAATLGAYLDLWEAAGLRVFVPYYLTVTAQALLVAGDRSGARARCGAAQAVADRTAMRFYEPETARILALAAEDEVVTGPGLHDALLLARRQGARLLELRIALDLADHGAGHEPLRTTLAAFPPDADSADLDRARRLVG